MAWVSSRSVLAHGVACTRPVLATDDAENIVTDFTFWCDCETYLNQFSDT